MALGITQRQPRTKKHLRKQQAMHAMCELLAIARGPTPSCGPSPVNRASPRVLLRKSLRFRKVGSAINIEPSVQPPRRKETGLLYEYTVRMRALSFCFVSIHNHFRTWGSRKKNNRCHPTEAQEKKHDIVGIWFDDKKRGRISGPIGWKELGPTGIGFWTLEIKSSLLASTIDRSQNKNVQTWRCLDTCINSSHFSHTFVGVVSVFDHKLGGPATVITKYPFDAFGGRCMNRWTASRLVVVVGALNDAASQPDPHEAAVSRRTPLAIAFPPLHQVEQAFPLRRATLVDAYNVHMHSFDYPGTVRVLTTYPSLTADRHTILRLDTAAIEPRLALDVTPAAHHLEINHLGRYLSSKAFVRYPMSKHPAFVSNAFRSAHRSFPELGHGVPSPAE
ncbi:hypothetical protein ACRALDRAFT_213305 [Sodiomyces alcalophilus JCM 7366]|uniref:uncharacterized protein n=1 Tax=Sodiomyces alcalophilus JCM 7366 TaxID=591952 RepID=UPI0039B3D82C